jgi:hypothetical protein
MHKYIIALLFAGICSFCCLQPARAQAAPAQYVHSHALNAVYSEWTVPYHQDGALLSLQALGITNSATVAVNHITTYETGKALTNTVESALAVNTLYVYPERYQPPQSVCTNTTTGTVITTTPVKPVYLTAGDRLSFVLSATNSPMTVIIKPSLRE